MKQADEIKKLCKTLGLKIGDVLREAKVSDDTLFNWSKKEPKSFETKRKIYEAIEKMKSKSQQ